MGTKTTTESFGGKLEAVREFGHQIDFGKAAGDYAKHRAGFPDAFFDRLVTMGTARDGMKALDLGTGTGTIARGLAIRGLEVTGLDKSTALMEQAKLLDAEAGVAVRYVERTAEATGFGDHTLNLVTAGQCWHWFKRDEAAKEARRILRPGGHMVIGHFDWVVLPGNVADVTENLIRTYNDAWKLGGRWRYYPWIGDLEDAGFQGLESFSFDEDTPYSHEAWRGRIRASAGIGASSMSPERIAQFDAELATILKEKFPEPMTVQHRIYATIGASPG
jgi:ubiquinone/menaquinone biosynthesis C-methylase UbiE